MSGTPGHVSPDRSSADLVEASAAVVVIGAAASQDLCAELMRHMQASGFSDTVVLDRAGLINRLEHGLEHRLEDESKAPRTAGAPLVISVSGGAEEAVLGAELDELSSRYGFVWMRTVLSESRKIADVGPVFGPHTSCFRCFSAVHLTSEAASAHAEAAGSTYAREVFVALVALRVVCDAAGLTVAADQAMRRYSLPDLAHVELLSAAMPGCERCDGEATTAAGGGATLHAAVLYEQYMSCRVANPIDPAARAAHEARARSLSRQTKRLPTFRQQPLPGGPVRLPGDALNVLGQRSAPSSAPLSLAGLAGLLRFTAGLRRPATPERRVLRWAASAGNLGSVELFMLTRGMNGLPAGLYFYQPAHHTLAAVELRSGELDMDLTMRSLLPESPRAEVAVLFTSAFARLQQKYGPFAYKLSLLDAGVALAQFHFVARSFGFWSQTMCTWPDDLVERLCGLTPFQEQVTAVVALSHTGAAGDPEPQRTGQLRIRSRGTSGPVSRFAGLPSADILSLLYAESRTDTANFNPPFPAATRSERDGEEGYRIVPLRRPPKTPAWVLSQRRTARRFRGDAIHLEQVSAFLYAAVQADRHDGFVSDAQLGTLHLLVAARRVNGIPPALYRFDVDAHALLPGGSLPTPAEERAIFRDEAFPGAPIFVWICGDVAKVCDMEGGFGHRKLLLRAGAMANRLWLGALAVGLDGAIVAGLWPERYARSVGVNGIGSASLVGFVAGAKKTG